MIFRRLRPVPRQVRAAILVGAAVGLLSPALRSGAFAQTSGTDRWVGTWTTAEVGRPQTPPPNGPAVAPFMANNRCPAPPAPTSVPPPGQTFAPRPYAQFTNQTLRQIVHTSVGGSKARVVLSNAYGTTPVTIGAGFVALRAQESTIQAPTGRPLTFSGRPTITIPPNAVVYSDPVSLTVPPTADLAIDLYLPGNTNTAGTLTLHNAAMQTSYVSETGNHVGEATLPTVGRTQSWLLLSRVDLVSPDAVGAIVAFGDSITDGARSTPDTNNRWPDLLEKRLLAQGLKFGMLNAGIGGNRVLSEVSLPAGFDIRAVGAGMSALARFEHHVLSQPGVTHVIVLEGINDIGGAGQNPTPTAEDLIAGHKQLI
ncbi:MAG TPA: SGNH/GDSL hydrolase family protein, partial [Vicinamibacterales bacterium]|nr:SGNH/GDSL hydrolase family protein [Vicinamibacterales bacterium]